MTSDELQFAEENIENDREQSGHPLNRRSLCRSKLRKRNWITVRCERTRNSRARFDLLDDRWWIATERLSFCGQLKKLSTRSSFDRARQTILSYFYCPRSLRALQVDKYSASRIFTNIDNIKITFVILNRRNFCVQWCNANSQRFLGHRFPFPNTDVVSGAILTCCYQWRNVK